LEGLFEQPSATVDEAAQTVRLRLSVEVYPVGALLAASYTMLDRVFVHLDAPEPSSVLVTLAWKRSPDGEGGLERLGGEFLNELLSSAWRARISDESRTLIESATARALAGAMGAPSLDDLETFDFAERSFEDPLGIAQSWEDKYGKRKPEGTP